MKTYSFTVIMAVCLFLAVGLLRGEDNPVTFAVPNTEGFAKKGNSSSWIAKPTGSMSVAICFILQRVVAMFTLL